MAKIYIILIIIILILFGVALFLEFPEKQEDNKLGLIGGVLQGQENSDNPEILDDKNSNSNSDSNTEQTSSGSFESSSSSVSTPSNSTNEDGSEIVLPDIESSPCGYYFDGYEVCGGNCVQGSCVEEGESCYCKI